MTKFEVEIVSDTVCPWSYIGKKNLDRAIATWKAAYPDAEFEIVWRPFYLSPKARVSAYEKRVYYALKFGQSRVQHVFELLQRAGDDLGIVFNWDGKTGHTRNSHKLIALANELAAHPPPSTTASFMSNGTSPSPPPTAADQAHPAADAARVLSDLPSRLIDELFRGYFERGGDMSDEAFLVQCAVSVGMDERLVRDRLASEPAGRAIDEAEAAIREGGEVEAVPRFTIARRFLVGGCQGPDVFVHVFERAEDAIRNPGRVSRGTSVASSSASYHPPGHGNGGNDSGAAGNHPPPPSGPPPPERMVNE